MPIRFMHQSYGREANSHQFARDFSKKKPGDHNAQHAESTTLPHLGDVPRDKTDWTSFYKIFFPILGTIIITKIFLDFVLPWWFRRNLRLKNNKQLHSRRPGNRRPNNAQNGPYNRALFACPQNTAVSSSDNSQASISTVLQPSPSWLRDVTGSMRERWRNHGIIIPAPVYQRSNQNLPRYTQPQDQVADGLASSTRTPHQSHWSSLNGPSSTSWPEDELSTSGYGNSGKVLRSRKRLNTVSDDEALYIDDIKMAPQRRTVSEPVNYLRSNISSDTENDQDGLSNQTSRDRWSVTAVYNQKVVPGNPLFASLDTIVKSALQTPPTMPVSSGQGAYDPTFAKTITRRLLNVAFDSTEDKPYGSLKFTPTKKWKGALARKRALQNNKQANNSEVFQINKVAEEANFEAMHSGNEGDIDSEKLISTSTVSLNSDLGAELLKALADENNDEDEHLLTSASRSSTGSRLNQRSEASSIPISFLKEHQRPFLSDLHEAETTHDRANSSCKQAAQMSPASKNLLKSSTSLAASQGSSMSSTQTQALEIFVTPPNNNSRLSSQDSSFRGRAAFQDITPRSQKERMARNTPYSSTRGNPLTGTTEVVEDGMGILARSSNATPLSWLSRYASLRDGVGVTGTSTEDIAVGVKVKDEAYDIESGSTAEKKHSMAWIGKLLENLG